MRYWVFTCFTLFSISTFAQQDSVKIAWGKIAEFPGGELAMSSFFHQNLKCPEEAVKAGLQKTISAKIQIDSTGKVIKATLNRKYGHGIDEEVIRVLESMPLWIPAMREGKNVEITMPILFRIKCLE
ncbi:MAG: energy transducer TonB [Cytophagaceae bacterium]|nr:energy transducer TonB [Cytophagaceae bacterium]